MSEPKRFYVSPEGNDAAGGDIDCPFATLDRARNAIRRLKYESDGRLTQPIEVLLRSGTHLLTEPLRLGSGDAGTQDCPITYTAYPGETPIISSGMPIGDWRPYKDKIVCAYLEDVHGGLWSFRQLFCDGKRMRRARWPKYDENDPLYGGWAFIEEVVDISSVLADTDKFDLNRTWQFKVDPQEVGEKEDWFAPDMDDTDWGPINIDRQWTFQGHDYLGSAWYRTTVTCPKDFDKRKDLWLFFAAIDKEAYIYIDGEKVFEHTFASTGLDGPAICETPFIFDARPYIKPGGTHQITVRVDSREMAGGICKGAALVSSARQVDLTRLAGTIKHPRAFRYCDDQLPARWSKPHLGDVFVIPGRCWISDVIAVAKVDHDRRLLQMARPVQASANTLGRATHIEAGNRFYVENNIEDLTGPGQWCLDQEEGMVYFWPPDGDVASCQVTAPCLTRLFQMVGSTNTPLSHVHVRGLTFTQSQIGWPAPDSYYKTPNAGQAIYMENTQDCSIEDNEFDEVGGDAIRLQNTNARNRITGNHISYCGAYGIFVGASQRGFSKHDQRSSDSPSPLEWDDVPADRQVVIGAWPRSSQHVIANNHIHHMGVYEKHANGIAFFGISAVDVTVGHNHIHDGPRFGIGMMSGFGRIVIEYNDLHDLSLETCDTGGITVNRWYTYDKDPDLARGLIIRFNRVFDVKGCGSHGSALEAVQGNLAGGRIWTPYYSWAIYFDNGPKNVLVYGNITRGNMLGGIMVSVAARDVTVDNNIFLDSGDTQVFLLFACQTHGVRFRRNIFSYSGADADFARLNLHPDIDLKKVIEEFDHNVYGLPPDKALTISGLPTEAMERADWKVQDEASLLGWQGMGFDEHSVFGDPGFVDAAAGNYQLKPDSPALKLGFEPIDLARIGIELKICRCRRRASAPIATLPAPIPPNPNATAG